MVKRRSMVVGLGALATGSGAVFSSAALQSTSASNASFQVYTVQELNVTRGSSDYDREDNNISKASDLPQADVDGDTQGDDLSVNVATKNNASSQSLAHLLDVENNGTEPVNVAFGFSTFGSIVVDGDSTNPGDGEVTEDQVQGMYSFQVNTSDSSDGINSDNGTDISPGTSNAKDAPQNYKTIPAGETLAVDLVVDAPSEVVSAINQASDPSGNPFDKESQANTTLVNEILVGTESDLTSTGNQ
ncbi:hypothetical protein J2744_001642 [Halorubrum trapanicum]|uniref:DUF1102 domain-containing protein n=1 Tax=Halorubrum trapanicum TaxID=29284 RepID=A0A8J7R4R8_9EURY|nr:hypothetical protein [Halorubrum trapanicum]MBP1901959.1 hypothetical protein [Halorubrum trapanicum]